MSRICNALNHNRHHLIALALYVIFFVLFFSPVITKNHLLAPGDGANFYYPIFKRGFSLWSQFILSGYPAALDPQFITWYPLRWLSPDFNFFVISAYVLAGVFAYTLVWQLTLDSVAAWLAGLIYACGGFMVAHLGHTTIIHAAIWTPLLIVAINQMHQSDDIIGWLVGIAAVCSAILAGHLQIAMYTLVIGGVLAAYHTISSSLSLKKVDTRLLLLYATCFVLGIALSAIQLLPTADLAARSVRAQYSFEDFTSYSLPFSHLFLLFFPFLYGPQSAYFGSGNFTELACYFGATTLVTLSLVPQQKNQSTRFWLLTAIFALIFMIGRTPLGFLIYHLPVLGSFRAPARAGFILILACAVLFGFVVASIRGRQLDQVAGRRAVCLAILFYAATAVLILCVYDQLQGKAVKQGLALPAWWRNLDLLQPLGLAICTGAWLLLTMTKAPRTCIAGIGLLVVADLVLFGQRLEWSYASSPTPTLVRQIAANQSDLHQVSGRILPADGYLEPSELLLPNMNEIYGIPSAGGYGPLLPIRYGEGAGVNPSGQFDYSRIDDTLLQLLNINRLSLDSQKNKSSIVLGNGCGAVKHGPLTIPLTKPMAATSVRLVSTLACSVAVADGTVMATVEILGETGMPVVEALPVRAGIDTAEWAIEKDDVARAVKHGMPSITHRRKDNPSVLEFEATHSFKQNKVYALRISYDAAAQAAIRFETIELKNEESGETQRIYTNHIPLADETRWSHVEFQPRGRISASYRKALGYAWLVERVVSLASPAALKAIQQGKLPNEKSFDPARTAVVENASPELAEGLTRVGKGTVKILSIENDRWLLESNTEFASFLVISQNFDPGWIAYVDGRRVPLLATDYILQGVTVPAGVARIELRYVPTSFVFGASVTAISSMVIMVVIGWSLLRRKDKPV